MSLDFNISSFFDKFKNAALKEMGLRQVIVDSVDKITSIKIDAKNVELKNKIIRIQTNPTVKNHIFMKKELILADIREKLPNFIVTDLQ
jgi:hypothetical protein